MMEEQKAKLQEAIDEGKDAAAKKKEDLLDKLEEKKRPQGTAA